MQEVFGLGLCGSICLASLQFEASGPIHFAASNPILFDSFDPIHLETSARFSALLLFHKVLKFFLPQMLSFFLFSLIFISFKCLTCIISIAVIKCSIFPRTLSGFIFLVLFYRIQIDGTRNFYRYFSSSFSTAP